MHCIYCRRDSRNSVSYEHVIPESLGNTEWVLLPGVVCDDCQAYLGTKVEPALFEHPHIAFRRVLLGVKSKKNVVPKKVTKQIDMEMSPTRIDLSLDARKGKVTAGKDYVMVQLVDESRNFDTRFSRALHKIAIGAMGYFKTPEFALDPRFDNARKFVRHPQTNQFRPYGWSLSGSDGIHRVIIGEVERKAIAVLNILGALYCISLENQPWLPEQFGDFEMVRAPR